MLDGRRSRELALERYGAFSAAHGWKYAHMLQTQTVVPRLGPRALAALVRMFERHATPAHWAFGHYLRIAPPEFALPAPRAAVRAPPPRSGGLSAAERQHRRAARIGEAPGAP